MQLQLVRSESHGTEEETSPSPHSQAAGSREEGAHMMQGTTQRHHPNYESQLQPSPPGKHQG